MGLILQIRWRNGEGDWKERSAEVSHDENAQERLTHLAMTVWGDIKNYLKSLKKKGRKK